MPDTTLPPHRAPAEAGPVDGLSTDLAARSRVVIVDDAPVNIKLLQQVLETVGITNVRGFTDPGAAIEHCASIPPDLVLLDMHMPAMDGLEVLRHLRALEPAEAFLPVLMLTADSSAATRNRALAAGASDFLTKPYERVEVTLRAANLLRTKSLYEELRRRNEVLQRTVDEHDQAARATRQEWAARHRRLDRATQPDRRAVVFQPIADLTTGEIMGFEALTRFTGPPGWTPDLWFAEAEALGRGTELELCAISSALSHLADLPRRTFLSVNVSPMTASTHDLAEAIESCDAPERLVLELTEHVRVPDYAVLLDAIGRLRRMGISIAVDDTGAGYAGLQHLLRIRPQIIKLDTDLTQGIDTDPARRALAAGLMAFAEELHAVIVAEGIEVTEELEAIRGLGITWGQGYLLARPAPTPLPTSPLEHIGTATAPSSTSFTQPRLPNLGSSSRRRACGGPS